MGVGYLGTDKIETSTANQEIVPAKPAGWGYGYGLYALSFYNENACVVKINKTTRVYLRASQGFVSTEKDAMITSFVIETPGVAYNFLAGY